MSQPTSTLFSALLIRVKQPEKTDNEYLGQNKCPLEEDQLEAIFDWPFGVGGNSMGKQLDTDPRGKEDASMEEF